MNELSRLTRLTPQLSGDYLEHHALLPMNVAGEVVRVATWREHVDARALDDLRIIFDAEPELERLPEASVRAAMNAAAPTTFHEVLRVTVE